MKQSIKGTEFAERFVLFRNVNVLAGILCRNITPGGIEDIFKTHQYLSSGVVVWHCNEAYYISSSILHAGFGPLALLCAAFKYKLMLDQADQN